MHFYAFEMATAITFLCKNAVEAIQAQNHRNRRNSNCFYSIFAKKRKKCMGIAASMLTLCVHPIFKLKPCLLKLLGICHLLPHFWKFKSDQIGSNCFKLHQIDYLVEIR